MSKKHERVVVWISCLLFAWFLVGGWLFQYVPNGWPELAKEVYAASVLFAFPLSMFAGATLRLDGKRK